MSLREMIALTYAYYFRGQTLADAVLEMYAGDLADLDQHECMLAYQAYRRNPANKQFPLPAQIRDLVTPGEFIAPEVLAREVAARIVAAIPKYGWNNGAEARAFIGHEGWGVVERQGGWAYLCEHVGMGISPSAFQAQVRDQLIGDFKHGRSAIERSIFKLPNASERRELTSAKNILSSILDNDNEKDPA